MLKYPRQVVIRLIKVGLLKVKLSKELMLALDEETNSIVPSDTIEPKSISVHKSGGMLYINTKERTFKLPMSKISKMHDVIRTAMESQVFAAQTYMRKIETAYDMYDETSILYTTLSSIATYDREDGIVMARYGQWIRRNSQSIKDINIKVKIMQVQINDNVNRIEFLNTTLRELNDTVIGVQGRMDYLEKRMNKYEKQNIGKVGRFFSAMGKGIERYISAGAKETEKLIDKVGPDSSVPRLHQFPLNHRSDLLNLLYLSLW